MYKLGLEKAEEPEIKLPTFIGSSRKREDLLHKYAKTSDCVDPKKLQKILKEMGIPDHLTAPWETCMRVKKQQLEPGMELLTGS